MELRLGKCTVRREIAHLASCMHDVRPCKSKGALVQLKGYHSDEYDYVSAAVLSCFIVS